MNVQRTKLAEQTQVNLIRRQAALKDTLDTITMLEKLEKENPGAYGHALTQLRIKRDRQNQNVLATEALLKALEGDRNLASKTGPVK